MTTRRLVDRRFGSRRALDPGIAKLAESELRLNQTPAKEIPAPDDCYRSWLLPPAESDGSHDV